MRAIAVAAYLVVLDPLVGVIVLVCAVVTPIVPSLSRRLLADPQPGLVSGRARPTSHEQVLDANEED